MPPHLPGYHLTEEIYTGRTTAIYRGTRVRDTTPVIIKLLRDDCISPAAVAELRHEYAITNSVALPGVIHVYALEYPVDRPALILEDIGGSSLAAYLANGALPLLEWLQLALMLCDALGTIHARQIIHKDIKPQNIIYNPHTQQAKLTDFGIATRLTRESPELFQPEVLEGTLAYLSPEQTGRMNRSIDHRSDLYSLGITLYEAITGQLPFEANDPVGWVHSHIARAPIPPEQVVPTLPAPISAMILKLLAKVAEDRYQSVAGLRHDLERCKQMLLDQAIIQPFTIGSYDPPIRLQLAQKLYGRDQQIAELLESFERVNLGRPELFLVAGVSGVGKSALVHEIHRVLIELRGYFISGKFDQLHRNIPYASLIQAFQDLVRQILAERTERIILWRERLLEALEGNGQVLSDVIPEIELIIGKQPAVATLPPTQAQNRFGRVIRQFINAFARAEHPLVIFLDDLQWADLASLALIELLMSSQESQHLFIIGSYRHHEVDSAHPLALTLDRLQHAGATVHTVEIDGLQQTHIAELIRDSFQCSADAAAPLAAILFEKTAGNPFFVNQFVGMLYEEQLIGFDTDSGQWQWQLDRIKQHDMTDNVLDLMTTKIRRLTPESQEVLQLAACLGNRFDLATLATIDRHTPEQTAMRLWPAVTEGLIIPIGADYKLVDQLTLTSPADTAILDQANGFHQQVRYRFLHDRVQQASYSLISEEQRRIVHLQIGMLLLTHTTTLASTNLQALEQLVLEDQHIEEQVFDIVGHLNAGASLLENSNQQAVVAALNLRAGIRAMGSAAHGPALSYFRTGLSLLDTNSWRNRYDLTLALHLATSEAAHLTGHYDLMERLTERAMDRARTALDRVLSGEIRIAAYIAQNRSHDAVDTALRLLRMLGVVIPATPTAERIRRRVSETARLIQQFANSQPNGVAALADLPAMSNPAKLAAVRILAAVTAAIYNTNPRLHPIVTSAQARLILKYGNPPSAPYIYTSIALMLARVPAGFEACFQISHVAIRFLQQIAARPQLARVHLNVYAFVSHWQLPMQQSLQPLAEGYRVGLETGDFEFGGICAYAHSYYQLIIGSPLAEAIAEAEQYSTGLRSIRRERPYVLNEMIRGTMLAFAGRTEQRSRIEATGFVEELARARFQHAKDYTSLGVFHVLKLMLSYYAGEYETAHQHAQIARQLREAFLTSIFERLLIFYNALTELALGVPFAQQANYTADQADLQRWATASPTNYRQKYALVQAEAAHLMDHHGAAREYYDEAIQAAREGGFANDEALACELAARYYAQRGIDSVARAYLRDARIAYLRWGALSNVTNIDNAYPDLLPTTTETPAPAAHQSDPALLTRTIDAARMLDLTTVMRAAQAIAGEIRLEQLIARLLHVIIENAGAQRGVLILGNADDLLVEAEAQSESKTVDLIGDLPLEASNSLPVAVINYVARTRRSIVLADANRDTRFAHDPYVAANRPASLIAMPLLHQGNLNGVVYLENNLTSDAFTAARLEVLGLLAGQAATAIANARLYAELDLHRGQLEQRVAERTHELRESNLQLEAARDQAQQANQAKSSFLSNMSHELRTPLNAIIGYSDMLIEETTADDQSHLAADLRKIRTAGQHLLGVINDILDLSKIEAGKMALYLESFTIHSLVQDVVSTIEPLIEKRGNTLRIELEHIPYEANMHSDLIKTRQILFNLLSNASKFTEQGIITLRVWQEQSAHETPMVAFEVQDSGIGMTDEQLNMLFQPFMQADLSTTRKYGGTGLGLTITRYFCHMLGGSIRVASTAGLGSTFTVMLPLALAA
jgi:predicted ATPase/signal transduction histidine kinase